MSNNINSNLKEFKMNNLIESIVKLNRKSKQLIMVAFDLIIIISASYFSIALSVSSLIFTDIFPVFDKLLLLLIITSIALFINNGFYRSVLKYMGYHIVLASIKANSIVCIILFIASYIEQVTASFPLIIIYWFVINALIIGSRYTLKYLLYSSRKKRKLVGIYGAGSIGIQIINSLAASNNFLPIIIFDNDSSKWGTVINNLIVKNPNKIERAIKQNKLDLIVFAAPEIPIKSQKIILRKIANYPIELRIIYNTKNQISGEIDLSHSKRVQVEDLLGREPIENDSKKSIENIKNKNILVTGAGGSIGSELCRQIIELKPTKLILLDHSEFCLYKLYEDLIISTSIEIIPILSSVTELNRFKSVIKEYSINIIYHAAAYKHVPMVEINPIDGIRNNIIGTYVCIKAALSEDSVESLVLISSDKAVRPTNIMGATKRFSELIVQSAQDLHHKKTFSIVRFGNVLDSTGSVVPLFRKQIQNGGPVTVTHPKITRYFMSINEAVHLVIRAGVMAKGGEVFVLEMGEPIKILDLAKKMIHLNGHEVISSEHPDGDIEIKISGMRPGEKLFEELLIGENVYSTSHPQILQAFEQKINWQKINVLIDNIIEYSNQNNIDDIITIFVDEIEGYQPSDSITSHEREQVELQIENVLAESSIQKGIS
jgi:FlaA1/EpsC-like NDP-sugar epimerase